MRKTLTVATAAAALLLSAGRLPAAETLLAPPPSTLAAAREFMEPAEAKWRKRWAISLAPLAVSQSLDAASSYGRRELNPFLAGSHGDFGTKATGVKFGVTGALVGVEYFLVKKYPRSVKFFTVVNWTAAGATTGLAVHNFRLPRN